MVAVLLFAIVQRATWMDRAAFCKAIQQVQPGWTESQVRGVLGDPDDTWSPGNSTEHSVPQETNWCYGTSGHLTMPTLGFITIRDGKVRYSVGGQGQPPSLQVIGESELRASLRTMFRWQTGMQLESDSQRLIQVANLLIAKGRAKALAILGEYCRVNVELFDDWLFWVVRLAFTSRRPGGVFPVPRIGLDDPPPPKDLRRWPTFPVITIDDIPICLFSGADISGFPEPFSFYMKDNKNDWSLRKSLLTPPNDPFPVLKKVVASPQWPYPRVRHTQSYFDGEDLALSEILTLVSTAYRPTELGDSIKDYNRYHHEFLALGCHWDVGKQMYVRRDGSVVSSKVLVTSSRK